ncbi:MAG: AAA family ATPase [Geminicoccaceae bacterium]
MDVGAWLRGLGLGQYEQAFLANDVDSAILPDLTSEDLAALGVHSVGHRRKLLTAIAALDAVVAERPAAPTADPVAARPAAERRQLTVMLVDLVGSTALATHLDPEAMSEVLRAYQNSVAGEILRFEGHVAKFMGDGVLAYFGWPRAHEDEAERSVRAALAIVAAVSRLTGGGTALACRVGIATGLVVVGDLVGEGPAQEHAVVGDTPNFAARLQGVAAPGQVVVSELTRRLLGDQFTLQPLPLQELRGIAEPQETFAVIGERPLSSRFAARQAGALEPLVGREQELALLLERWRQASGGEGQLVLLTGEAGIGKSRIAEALIEAVAGAPHTLVRFQCTPYHTDSALHPAIHHLATAAGIAERGGDDEGFDRLEAYLTRAGAADGETPALLAQLLGLDGTARYGQPALTPQQRRSRTLASLATSLIGTARRQPVLWVVEDAHWIDPTTLELIELVLDRIQNLPVLAVVTARPTFTAAFASHPIVSRLALNRLARGATAAIIARIAHGRPLPGSLLDEIAARTDGVPLFVEEMTKAVLESDGLREAGGPRLDGRSRSLAIPTTLHDSLMARLDRLHPVKEVAQTAAVIGRAFDHATIAALSALPVAELGEAMGRLVEAELVFRRGTPPDATYLFKHALVRDAAYESLLKTKRATLHARLADILAQRGDVAPEIVARHAEAAGRTELALQLWEEAGVRALARPAYREAVASFENAIRLCGGADAEQSRQRREQTLQLQLGQALIANQGYQAPTTLAAFDRALELADSLGDVALQLPALFGLWAGHHIAGTGSRALADRYAGLADSQAETGPRLVGLRMLGLERFYEGRFRESLAITKAGLEAYRPDQHHDLAQRFGHDPRAASANYKAWNLWHLGLPDQAEQTMQENLHWTRQVDHANTTGLVLCFGTMTFVWLREADRVMGAAREAITLADEMALPLWHAWGRTQLGWALSQADAVSGIAEMEAGIAEARQIGAGRFEPFHLGLLAEALNRAGRHAEAGASLARAFEGLALGHHRAFAAELHRVRAAVLRHEEGAWSETAVAELRAAISLARTQEAASLELRAVRDLAAMLAEAGERGQAADLLAPVYSRFTEGLATRDLLEARALLDALG